MTATLESPPARNGTLPPYVAPPGIPEEAKKLADELAQLLAPIAERETEVARLTATRDEITRRKGQKKLNPEDRNAILEAAADRMQVEALSERIEALESEDTEKPIVGFLVALPAFYRRALVGYRRDLVDYFAAALSPAFSDPRECKQTLEPILPASNSLDWFLSGETLVRLARSNPVGLARTHLAHLAKLAAGKCPWQWPPAK